MTKKKETFSNDATSKLLGYDYQKLVALEICLDAKRNEHIWIECKGDVATKDTSIEVKHHGKPHNLSSNSVDVWKTIKNYVTEKELVKGHSHLRLHTTSTVSDDSIFDKWNGLSASKKRTVLLKHSPSETIKDFHALIKKCPATDLKAILEKFSIETGQSTIKEKWEEIKDHSVLITTPESFRDAAVELLYGYITKAAIDNEKKWQISINDFQRDVRTYLSKFSTGNTPFPLIPVEDIDLSGETFIFVERMRAVNLKSAAIELALSDYLRAQLSQIELLKMTPTLDDSLREYDDSVLRRMTDAKLSHSNNVEANELNAGEAHKKSRDLYFSCKAGAVEKMLGVDGLQKYYRDGRIDHQVEITAFEWKFGEDDL
jgi:hypothetical protein